MKNLVVLTAFLLLCLGTAWGGGPPAGKGRPYMEGEILVKYKAGVTAAAQETENERHGAREIKTLRPIGVHRLGLPQGMAVEEAVRLYKKSPDVEYAEPNYVVRVAQSQIFPNDPDFSKQWYLYNNGQQFYGSLSGLPGADISAPEAWYIHTGDGSVVVAVVDTGVDYTHPDLAANIWHNPGEANCTNGIDDDHNGKIDDCVGWDFANNDNDPMDDFADSHGDVGHGTRVAGIIGAVGNNGIGVCGINWNVQIMPLKFMDSAGTGYVSGEAAAIDYAVQMGAKIINASYGQSASSNTEKLAIQAAKNAGVLFVAAAGNGTPPDDNDTTPFYPASYALDNIISVAASDYNDDLASFSNYGPASVHLAAPGEYIYSTIPGPGYDFLSGTSFSAPMVSAAAALLMSGDPSLDYSLARQLILSTVDAKASLSGKVITGGRLDLFKALSADPNNFIPVPPSALVAQAASTSEISLSWTDNSTNETGFDIERRPGSGGTFLNVATVGPNITAYNDTGLGEAMAFTYRVKAVGSAGDSSYSNEAATATLPAAPTALAAAAVSASRIDLSWDDNSSGELGYRVERKTGAGGIFAEVAAVAADVSTFSDAALASKTTYYYRVRAYSAGGNSSFSNEASATTASISGLEVPGGLTASAASTTEIDLGWTDTSSSEDGFQIERRTAAGSFSALATVGANVTSYADTGLAASTTYTYRVKAVNGEGTSGYSNEASATTRPLASSGGGGGGCFIATAAYGSYLAPQVKVLRDFRDSHLLTNAPGRMLVSYYYRYSPPWAEYLSRHAALRAAARVALTPLVYGIKYPLGALLLTLCAAAALVYYEGKRKNRR